MKNVRAILIIEIAGRPAEHIREALRNHVGQMKNIKGLNYLSERISEAKLINEEKEVYSCFAEVEVEVENLFKLAELIFDYFPSSVEVIEPSNISFSTNEATMFLTDLAGRLHKYDEIAKVAQMTNQQLINRLKLFQTELAKQKAESEKKGTKTKKSPSKKTKKTKKK
jgi:hypothetical protein